MHSGLEEAINEFGGKHGALQFLREQPEGRNFIPPTEVLGPNESLSYWTWRRVMAACNDEGSSKVILRTSETADWKGMVDTMPTQVMDKGGVLSLFEAKKRVAALRETCRDPRLSTYSKQEGTGYDPSRVTVSLTPYLGSRSYTLTEHPNQEGMVMVDRTVKGYKLTGGDAHSIVTKRDDDHHFVNEVREWVRALGILPEDVALQMELGGSLMALKLFQVKDFAAVKHADFELPEDAPGILDGLGRHFGVTDPEGLVVHHSFARTTRDGMRDIPAPHGPILFFLDMDSSSLSLDHHHPDMLAYVTGERNCIALSHHNTRFVQAVLRKNGVARLVNVGSEPFDAAKSGDGALRITSDGVRWAVTPA